MKDLLTLDYETYFAQDYTLRPNKLCNMNTSEYIRDDRFKAHMVGVKINAEKTFVLPHEDIKKFMKGINWKKTELLAHNTAFDGLICNHHYGAVPAVYRDTLSMARALHSNEIGASLDEVAKLYGVGNKMQDVLDQSKGIRDLHSVPGLYDAMAAYCAVDVDLCWAIYMMMTQRDKFPEHELELIHLTLQCFCDPVLRVDVPRVRKLHQAEITRKQDILEKVTGSRDLAEAKQYLGKDTWLAAELQARGVEPPLKYSVKKSASKGEDVFNYAFAKGDEAFLDLLEHEDEEVRLLVEARLEVKSALNETRALRMLNAAAKPHWRLPVGYSYYGAHCVPEDTEVFTPTGWVRIDQWQGGPIAQVDTNQNIEFLPATRFVGPVENTWVKVAAPYLKCDFTLGHTMPYLRQKSHTWGAVQAGNFVEQTQRKVPLAGVLTTKGGLITAYQMRVLAMVQADGSFETDTRIGRRLTIFIKKPRKVERARTLLMEAGITFTEQTYESHPGFVRFIIAHRDWPTWLTPERKYLGAWLLDSTDDAREAFMEELVHWDGNKHNGQVYFSTSEAVNADWVSTLAHLTGRCASTTIRKGTGNRRDCYSVAIRQRDFGLVRRSHIEIVIAPRRTYCTETQTGFWLARHNGRIFVTGNTGRWSGANKFNMQNLPRGGELRKCILAPVGYHIITGDSSQIEARVLAYITGNERLLDVFRSGADPYSFQATEMYGHEVVKDRSPQDDEERQIGKVAMLALGYQGGSGAFTSMAKNYGVRLPDSQVKQIVNKFRRANPEYVKFWAVCEKVIEGMYNGRSGSFGADGLLVYEGKNRNGHILLPNNMRLKYPDIQVEYDELSRPQYSYRVKNGRKKLYSGLLCENIIQALARIVVAEQIAVISRRLRLTMTTHDEGSWLARSVAAKKEATWVKEQMSVPPAWAPDLPVGSDVKHAAYYCK